MTTVQNQFRSFCALFLMTVSQPLASICSETVTFRFSGQIRSVAAELGDEVKIGDPCTVDVSFDSDTAPVFAGLPW